MERGGIASDDGGSGKRSKGKKLYEVLIISRQGIHEVRDHLSRG